MKRLMIVCTVLVLAVFVGLYGLKQGSEARMASKVAEVNAQLSALQEERAELMAQLGQEDNLPQDAEAEAAQEEPEEASDLLESNALLCVNGADSDFYQEVYPLLQETDTQGLLILRNGKLPGDNFELSTVDFLDLLQNGWSYAITLEREEGQSEEEWLEDVSDYMDRLQRRIAVLPDAYCFAAGSYDAEAIPALVELGLDTILYDSEDEPTPVEDVRQICLLDYQTDLEAARRDGQSGYLGLEIWMTWSDDTAEELRYDADALQTLLEQDTVQFQSLENLQENAPVAESPEQETPAEEPTVEQPTSVQERIDQIDQEIQALYQNLNQ